MTLSKYIISAISTAIVIAALSGCGGKKATTIVMAPDFQKGFIINASMAVVLLDEEPEIVYFGDAKKSLAPTVTTAEDGNLEPEALIWKYFSERIVKDIAAEVDVREVFKATVPNDHRITYEGVRTSEEDVRIEIPEIGTRFEFEGRGETALVLFLDKIRLGTETDPYYLERVEYGVTTNTGRKLIYLASFVLWDNRENKPVSYGRVKTNVHITREEATMGNWEEISRNFVRTIFEPTGFRKRGGR